MITVTLRIPEDVVEELKQLAPILCFSGYQPLIRAYIGQGMRADLEKLENNRTYAKYLSNPLFFVLFVPSWFIIP